MKTRTIYISDDGKEFDNYDECASHDWKLLSKRIDGKVTFFDHNLDPFKDDVDLFTKCEYCHGLIISNDIKNDINYFADLIYEETGFTIPRKVGYWVYDEETAEWIWVSEKIKELSHWETIFEKMSGF